MTAMKPIGRPLKFTTVADLESKINAYFEDCDLTIDTREFAHGEIEVIGEKRICTNCHKPETKKGCLVIRGKLRPPRPYTVTGLALALDTTRQTLLEYEGEVEGREKDPAFADAIKKAKQRIENYAEESLYDKEKPTRGVIFSLSNNAQDWTEKKSTELNMIDGAKELANRIFANALPPPTEPPATGEAE